ncbi:MAG: hypothetical protein IJZ72_05730 [Oscillospiraceae bacterium]|nr:hypothetical protein [Oscillospiraceae bacterium]
MLCQSVCLIWRLRHGIFSLSRIEYVEQAFNLTLPENAEPVRYNERLMGQDTVIQELYITGISDPDEFVESSIRGRIKTYSDMTDEELKARYGSELWYDKAERQTAFICVYESGYYYTSAYFFENENGLYDVKFIR